MYPHAFISTTLAMALASSLAAVPAQAASGQRQRYAPQATASWVREGVLAYETERGRPDLVGRVQTIAVSRGGGLARAAYELRQGEQNLVLFADVMLGRASKAPRARPLARVRFGPYPQWVTYHGWNGPRSSGVADVEFDRIVRSWPALAGGFQYDQAGLSASGDGHLFRVRPFKAAKSAEPLWIVVPFDVETPPRYAP